MELTFRDRPPGELLRIWRAGEDISQDALGELLGITGAHVSRLESGGFSPGLALATKIEQLTRGVIKAVSWVTSAADPEKVSA